MASTTTDEGILRQHEECQGAWSVLPGAEMESMVSRGQ